MLEKLNSDSNFSLDVMGGENGIYVGKEVNANPPDGEEKLEEEECPVGENSIAAPHDQIEADVHGIDFHHKEPVSEPRSGLEFKTKEAAYSFYREYARSVGFGITIKASRRSKKSGKFIDVKIVCSRFGIKREFDAALNPRSCAKTDCKASMHMKRRDDGIWVIHSFVKEHNHEINPDDFYQTIRGINKQLGVPIHQKKGMQLALSEEDLKVMLANLESMQGENTNFFYAVDLDHGKHLRNVLWIDPRAAHDYCSFCDVVFFDTFYITSKYHLPIVPIVGVNNHFQYILLGCALTGSQTASTYSWVMRTWLRGMGGTSPRVIITDQEEYLDEAVADAFPESCHCFFLWHVLRKIPGNLGYVTDKHENFLKEFADCVHRPVSIEQFENQWEKLVLKFELSEDDWVRSLYESRRKWVAVYMQDTFLAGFSTASRSESIVTFFDKYIRKETTMKEFMEKYKSYLHERYEIETIGNVESLDLQSSLISLSPIEKQMSTIYTTAIFKRFQDEVLGIDNCCLHKNSENEALGRFQVVESREDRVFILHWNEKHLEVCCSCRSFEYRGFLCRHAMFVLQTLGISSIPSQYILKRWTKDAKSRQTSINKSSKYSCRLERFNDLCRRAIKLGNEASVSQEAYDVAFQALQEALRHCVGVNNSASTVTEPSSTATQGSAYTTGENRGNVLGQSWKKNKKYKKRKEPWSLNSRAEEIYSCRHASQKDGPGTISSTTSERIIVPPSAQPQGGHHEDPPPGAEDAEPSSSVTPVRGPYYIDFSAGMAQVDPTMARVRHFDIQNSFQEREQPPGTVGVHRASLKITKQKHPE